MLQREEKKIGNGEWRGSSGEPIRCSLALRAQTTFLAETFTSADTRAFTAVEHFSSLSIDQPGWRASCERLGSRTGLEHYRHPSGSGHPVSGPVPSRSRRTWPDTQTDFGLSERRAIQAPALWSHSGAQSVPDPTACRRVLPVTFGKQSSAVVTTRRYTQSYGSHAKSTRFRPMT